MAKKSQTKTQKPAKSNAVKTASFWGLPLAAWIVSRDEKAANGQGIRGRVIIHGGRSHLEKTVKALSSDVPTWQHQRWAPKSDKIDEIISLTGPDGPIWLVTPAERPKKESHYGLMTSSGYARARDLLGSLVPQWDTTFNLATIEASFVGCSDEQIIGALVGMELGSYSFKAIRQTRTQRTRPVVKLVGVEADLVQQAADLAVATNIARQLSNMPPAELHPQSYASSVETLFAHVPGMEVEVWDPKALERERLGLMLAVGGGATNGPRLVRLRYRPGGSKAAKSPAWLLVGKGVTFDSGGLDIKPPAGMRLMKKDMAGSAALVGLAWWLVQSKVPVACDIYLGLAENAVDAAAFRPGDVIVSRSGQTVEVHNTDAEGRLVLADALEFGLEHVDDSNLKGVIDVATLTGAIKVGLGADIPGLFANDDKIADALLGAGQERGERLWRMPLVEEYGRELNSFVADLSNASNSPFGGAITAALFLKRFVKNKPWAHLDIYGWTDMPVGPYREVGATGQGVQALAEFLRQGQA